MEESSAWLKQADSDEAATRRERKAAADRGSRVLCRTVAKFQQAVEKFIKAIVAALRESGVSSVHPIGYGHSVQKHVRLLVRLPLFGTTRSVQARLKEFLDPTTRNAIQSLEALAPKAPAPGGPHPRNTEYPFNVAGGGWKYPASPGEFSDAEVARFQDLTSRVAHHARGIVRTLRRGPG